MNISLKPHNKKGFTAPELIVVIVLLGIALVPIMKNIVRMLPTTTNSRNITIATFLAMQVMEDLRSKLLCTSTKAAGTRCPNNSGGQNQQDPFGMGLGWDKTAQAFSVPFDKFKYTVSEGQSPYPTSGDMGSQTPATTYYKLKDINVTVWHDSNTNSNLDSFEDKVILESKIARRVSKFPGTSVAAPSGCPSITDGF